MTDVGSVAGNAGPPVLSIRPSRETILAAKRRALPATLVVAAGGVFRGIAFGSHIHSMAVWALVAVGLGLAALAAVGLWALYLSNARLLVTDDSFGRTTILGRPRLTPRRSLARLLKVSVLYGGASVPAPQWLFLDGEGKRLLAVSTVLWRPDDLDHFREALGVPLEEAGEKPVKVRELKKRLPQAVPWWQAHTIFLATVGLFVLIGALAPFVR